MFDNFNREGRTESTAQLHHRKQAENWTKAQAKRMGVEPADILAAIKRGMMAEQMQELTPAQAGDLPKG